MEVICLDTKAFYALVEEIVERVKGKEQGHQKDKWISEVEAMQMLRVTSKPRFSILANNGDMSYFKGAYKFYSFNSFFTTKSLKSGSGCPGGSLSGGGSGVNGTYTVGDNLVLDLGVFNPDISSNFGSTLNFDNTGSYVYTINDARTGQAISGTVTSAGLVNVTGGVVVSQTINVNAGITSSVTITVNSNNSGGCSGISVTSGMDSGTIIDFKGCFSLDGGDDNKSESTGDCPDTDGEIGTLPAPIFGCGIVRIFNTENGHCYDLPVLVESISRMLGRNLSSNELNFFGMETNVDKTQRLERFLRINETEEAKDFAEEAIDALMDDGEVDLDDRIITNFDLGEDFPCQSVIVKNTFKKTAPLSKLVLDIFDNDDSGYNLVFDIDSELDNTAAGGTYPISQDSAWELGKLDINIGLSEALLNNGTDLAIATTVVHESIHATLIYLVETNKLTVENTVNNDFDLRNLVRSYLEMKIEQEQFGGEPNAGDTDAHMHQYMTNFIKDIATAVSQFGSSQGYNISFNYYEKLAWLGLKSSLELLLADDSDGFTEEDQAEVDSINEVILDEFLNNPNAKGKKCTN